MVHDKIDNDIDSPLMACRDQIFKIVHRTVFRVNITVIRHIIFMVGCRWMTGISQIPLHPRSVSVAGSPSLI